MTTVARQHPAGSEEHAIAPPPLIYIGGLAAGLALEAVLPSASVPGSVRWGVGGVLAATGVGLARSFFRALTRSGTTVSPYSHSTKLVTTGPYRISRNPGYLGMTLAYSGTALLFGALWPFVTLMPVGAVVDVGVIRREERNLERTFGAEYAGYKKRTRRWRGARPFRGLPPTAHASSPEPRPASARRSPAIWPTGVTGSRSWRGGKRNCGRSPTHSPPSTGSAPR
jgi:protein-S-isoprenylcysteine O-methyltransferase Ste14